jgi:D-glycero-alpha-D-manno-heptose-7-phosphate kinase
MLDQNFKNLKVMRDFVFDFKKEITSQSDMRKIGEWISETWVIKRNLVPGITNEKINRWYDRGMEAGAFGGKLMGAGGGGFLMFIVPPEKQSALELALSDIEAVRIKLDKLGSRVIAIEDGE